MPRLCIAPIAIAALLTLSGCTVTAAQTPAQTGTAALIPAGPAATIERDSDENLQWSSFVVKVDFVPNQGSLTVKLFGLAGGDPAMNGLYTYIAFIAGPDPTAQIYRLGDFLDYRVLSAAPGRVDLEIRENTPSTPTSAIGSRTRNLIVTWTPGVDGAPPTAVATMPARNPRRPE